MFYIISFLISFFSHTLSLVVSLSTTLSACLSFSRSPLFLSQSLSSLYVSLLSLSLYLSLSSVWSIFVKPQINVQRRGSRKKLRVCSININIRFLSFSIVKKTFISKPQFFLQQTQFKLVVNCETIVIVL